MTVGALDRWLLLPEESPSGCALFRCLSCGAGPTKVPLSRCSAGCHDASPEVLLYGWRYREVRSRGGLRTVLLLPWGGDTTRVSEYGGEAWSAILRAAAEV